MSGEKMEILKQIYGTEINAKETAKAFAELEKQRDAGGGDEREEEEEKQGTAQQQVGAVHQVGQQKGPHDTAAFLLLHQLATVARHDHCELFEPRSQMFSFTSADEAERKGRRQTNAKGTEARTSPTPWQEQNGTQPTSSCPGPAHAVAPSSSGRPIRSQRTPMKEIITLDDPTELDEFMARGEEQCIHAMRAFITQFSLRQTTVATMTGVSQPYISKLLNGNHRELSLRCRKNIYCWYLNCRRHPEKLGQFKGKCRQSHAGIRRWFSAMFVQDPCTRLETSADGELVPQRRERYVFRPVLLRVLEAFFQECAFPDIAKRVEIANVCNAHLQMDKRGAQLLPKEVVTPQVIANWFANKRKEMRRRMGGTGAELGRSRLNSSSAGHSNSPWSPNSATLAQQERRVESRSEQSSNSDEATTAQWEQQAMPLPLLANANQQQTRLISDQHECAMSAVDLALLLPQLGPSAQPDHCPTAPPLLSQSVLQFAPSVDQLIHLLQAQPVANQLMLLQQLLVGTSSTDNDYLKQDQQHMLMAIHDQ